MRAAAAVWRLFSSLWGHTANNLEEGFRSLVTFYVCRLFGSNQPRRLNSATSHGKRT